MALGKNFRLPVDVRPTRYGAELETDLEQGSFAGRMELSLSLARPRKEIVLHAIDLQIHRAEARAGGKKMAAQRIDADAESQTVSLAFAEEIPKGTAVLDIAWQGKFTPGLRGLYRAGPVAVTQFEAADARRVFPCFDEPAFKVPFTTTLTIPATTEAIANSAEEARATLPDGRVRVRFRATPPLPSYLVAFAIGPFDVVSSADVPPSAGRARPLHVRGVAARGPHPRSIARRRPRAPGASPRRRARRRTHRAG